MPFYDEYLNERTEIEVETIKTLEAEPVMVDPAAVGSPAAESSEDETSEEFREQLQNVQKQLEALSSLPNTIQLTIAALTEQLAALAQPKRKSKSVTPRPAGIRIAVTFNAHFVSSVRSIESVCMCVISRTGTAELDALRAPSHEVLVLNS